MDVLTILGVACVAGIGIGVYKKMKVSKPPQGGGSDNTEFIPAEIVFSENIDKFKPLLKGVSKNQITNKEDWTSLIVSINNDELTSMWKIIWFMHFSLLFISLIIPLLMLHFPHQS